MNFSLDYKSLRAHKLLWIICFGLFLRLGVFLLIQPWTVEGEKKILVDDAFHYHNLAVELKEQGTFASSNPYLSAIRTPGYPLFIVGVYSIFGVKPWTVLIFQIVLDCLLIGLLFRFAAELFNKTTGILAALFYAIEPLAAQYVNTLYSDMLFVLFLLIAYYWLWGFIQKFQLKPLLLSFLILAVAAYIRPIALYLAVINIIFLGIYLVLKRHSPYKTVLMALVAFTILVTPWMFRNLSVHGHFFFSTSGNYNSLILYAADAEADARGVSATQVKKEYAGYFSKEFPEIKNANIYDLHERYKERALEIITEYPGAFVYSYFKGLADMFFSINRPMFEMIYGQQANLSYDAFELIRDKGISAISQIIKDYPKATLLYAAYMIGWYLFTYSFAMAGIWILFKQKDWLTLALLGLPILYFTLLMGQAGLARFKLPILAFYLIAAGYSFTRILQNRIGD